MRDALPVWLHWRVRTEALADPRRCPACRGALPVGTGAPLVCPECELDLRGPAGMQLFALLTSADQLIGQIRSRTASAAAPAGPTPAAPMPAMTPAAPLPAGATAVRRSGLRGTSVPGVLLTLGALCVLVAGALFLPFAWELLGVVGRTVVLVVLTVLAGLGAHAAGTRGLRATSESLGAVALGLLALDVWGADTSGWFGDISGAGLALLLGVALALAGSATTLWVAATPVRGHVAGQAAAVLGSVVGTVGLAGLTWGSLGQRLALAVGALLLLATVSWTLSWPPGRADAPAALRGAASGHACVAATTWLVLVATGLARLEEGLDLATLWPDGAGLDLVLAGALVAVAALPRSLPRTLRLGLLAVATVPWAVALTAPAYDEGPTARVTLALAVVVVGVLGWLALGSWRVVAAPLGVIAGTAAILLLVPLGGAALEAASEAAGRLWAGRPDGDVTVAWDEATWGPAWLLPVGVLVLAATLALVARIGSLATSTLLVAGVTVLATAGALLMGAALVWVVVALLVATALGASVAAARASGDALELVPALAGAAALYVATYDELLTLVSAAALLGVAAARHLRGSPLVAELAGGAVVPLLALATWAGLTLAQVLEVWSALVVLLVGSATVVVRGLRPGGGVFGLEVGAVLAALPTVAVGVGSAGIEAESRWLALYLTVLGVATTTIALTRPDRRRVAWAGGLLLAMASWVRLEDLGVETVEAYTLPSALALLAVGWWQTRREHTSTLRAWSPGLGLALVPSLLWTLEDPLSWRALVLALACLVLTVVGAQARLAAPLVWGAGVGAALALWEVVPPALEASAWVVSGVAGAILLVLGASWDRRLSEARQVAHYVRRLR